VLLVAADLLARTLRAPADLPLGAVTALVGVPFFLLRLRRLAA
jgi:iron complex transport system permease protein